MFLTPEQIVESISHLKDVHPFHGITFLTCKKYQLPIGNKIEFPLDSKTDAFLQNHHRISPHSEWFFQPFKSSDRKKSWVRPDYSAKGLQAINTQTFAPAFIHERNTRLWGWSENYIQELATRLPKRKRIPAFHLAVWLYKEKKWLKETSANDIINFFLSDFHITEEEKEQLFDLSDPFELYVHSIFTSQLTTWKELRQLIQSPPDTTPDQGGILSYLEITGSGPAESLKLEPASRLTLITGDNGLGKTFLLECAWWALTGSWTDKPAYPPPGKINTKTEITFEIKGESFASERKTISFDRKVQSWRHPKNRPTIPGLIVYARVDGSFAVWDPAKLTVKNNVLDHSLNNAVFTCSEVWDGLQGQIEGLIRDWVRWQDNPRKYPFNIFVRVLDCLSPPDLGSLRPGEPIRIPDDPRDIPTVIHPYGEIPITYASAGVKRIITLAYLIVWAWNEHLIAAKQRGTSPQRRMVILVDEMEAHLHPRWQRTVLPALMSIGEMLSPELKTQFLVATHSPLVMASAEPIFSVDIDTLVHLDLTETGDVKLNEIDFVRFGDVSAWLTSPVFELKHARSSEAEKIIEEAKALQKQENPLPDKVKAVSCELIKYLGPDDKFWPRWIAFAEKYGVEI
jgi:AAA domain, putative AbiEii toxin, Type IV TA system/AAA domain